MESSNPDRIAYSARAAARLLGVDRSRISDAIAKGELRAFRLGRRRYALTRVDLDAWLARHPVDPAAVRIERRVAELLDRERKPKAV